jgi:hypothetical protein
MMTDTQQNDGPPFLADLADDAIMTGTILAKPQGKGRHQPGYPLNRELLRLAEHVRPRRRWRHRDN